MHTFACVNIYFLKYLTILVISLNLNGLVSFRRRSLISYCLESGFAVGFRKKQGNVEQRQILRLALIDFSLTVKVATLIFISGSGLAIPSFKEGQSGSLYNLVKNK